MQELGLHTARKNLICFTKSKHINAKEFPPQADLRGELCGYTLPMSVRNCILSKVMGLAAA